MLCFIVAGQWFYAAYYLSTIFLKKNVTCALECDNHVQNIIFGRYIVGYTGQPQYVKVQGNDEILRVI